MGKASSAKKVARVARAGGKSTKQRRPIGFPVAVVALLVVGVVAIALARGSRHATATTFPQANKDHIHMAYGIDKCGTWLAPIPQPATDPFGIHTHGDGVIHIHPFSASSAGKNARLSVFDDLVGLKLSKSGLSYPGVSVKGDCKGKPAVLRAGYWKSAFDKNGKVSTAKPDKIYTSGFSGIPLDHDRGAITFFYGPADAAIPLPPSVAELNKLTDVGPSPSVPAPSAPGATVVPGSTVPGASSVPGATPVVPPASSAAPATSTPPTGSSVPTN